MIKIARAVTPHDIDHCLAVRHKVFIIEQKHASKKHQDIYDAAAVHILARHGDFPVGCARTVINSAGTAACIGFVAVLKSFRQQGIGGRLLTALEISPELAHIPTLFLDTSFSTLDFYKHHGYRASDDSFIINGVQTVIAQKDRLI
jgi:predicted GNAT family N-acyltransferase